MPRPAQSWEPGQGDRGTKAGLDTAALCATGTGEVGGTSFVREAGSGDKIQAVQACPQGAHTLGSGEANDSLRWSGTAFRRD